MPTSSCLWLSSPLHRQYAVVKKYDRPGVVMVGFFGLNSGHEALMYRVSCWTFKGDIKIKMIITITIAVVERYDSPGVVLVGPNPGHEPLMY